MPIHQRNANDIAATIERVLPDLPPALRRVAHYVLDHTGDLFNATLEEVAEASNASKPTVVRFCQAVGFGGFREFQRALILHRDVPAMPAPTTQDSPRELMSRQPIATLIAALNSTLRALHHPSLQRAAVAIAEANRLVWFGQGDSGALVMSGDHRAMINGMASRACTELAELVNLSRQLTDTDALICISRSGRTPQVVQAIRLVTERSDVPIIAITGDPGSALAQLADVVLVSAPIDLYAADQRTTLQTAQMAVLDSLLAVALIHRLGDVDVKGVPAGELAVATRAATE